MTFEYHDHRNISISSTLPECQKGFIANGCETCQTCQSLNNKLFAAASYQILIMEQLNSALVSIKVLRARVGQVFETLGSGIRAEHGEDGRDTKFITELQELLNAVNNNLRYLL